MLVELPENEANEPLYTAIVRTVVVLVGGLILALLAALLLARLMVVPVRALAAGAARIGAGALDHRINIQSGDELEALGDQLNDMAAKLQGSYATLERKVEERTHQLQEANLSKSRFLAVASHDLRQPLHALNLFAAQLRSEKDPAERDRLAVRIDTAVANMNELFNALLDISKLDAGALSANISEFPVNRVLGRIGATFTQAARDKGLRLRVVPSSAWIRSDAILIEQILLNLVSNAVRYTSAGGIVVGCRRVQDACASRCVTAASALRRISSAASSASSIRLRRRNGAARSGWAWDWPSWNVCAPCWNTRSALRLRSGRARASRSPCRRCRRVSVPRLSPLLDAQCPTRCAASSSW